MRKITQQEQIRREKINKLKEMGHESFSKSIKFSHNSITLKEEFNKFTKDELHEKNVSASVVGRVMNFRGPFIIAKDGSGKVQAYIAKKEFPEIMQLLDLLDIGDIIYFSGIVMKTNTGEITIRANEVKLLTKALKPLPEKFHGLKDVEERYRRRYVDLIMNDEVKATFWNRSKIISGIRQFFDEKDYMEADTPVLQPILGGAAALPFNTHHNALDMPFYLRIATELPLKKLLVGGFDRVYEIGRLFRNEGIDTTHNPEFTTIEFYEAYSDLNGMISRTEELFSYIAKKLGKKELPYGEKIISLKTPFNRIHMVDAIKKETGVDFWKEMTLKEASEIAKKHKVHVEKFYKVGHIINAFFEDFVEDKIIQPTFITGHPVEISPLSALNDQDKRFTDRAELFIDGREYANMFTELSDPIDQLSRFESQLVEKESGNPEANEIDMDFIEALEYGMPPAGGCGVGIDRMVMLFTNNHSIREVLLFPHLKNKN